VRAELSSNSIGQDEAVELSVVVTAGTIDRSPSLESSSDFDVEFIGNATSMQISNGAVRREVRFRYRLAPKRAGTLRTPPGSITIDGQTYDIAPLEVGVTAGDATPKNEPKTTWVTQAVNASTVFVGEQLTNTIEIVTSKQLFEAQFGDLTYDGFRHIDIGSEQRSVRLVNGVPHTVITLRKALYPLKDGELTIPSRVLRAKVRVPRKAASRRWPFGGLGTFSDDLFDDFFGGGELRSVELRTDALAIVVKPLPPLPQGAVTWGTSGPIVGHTGINVVPQETAVRFGDAVTATVKLASAGNISLVENLPFPESPDVRVYQDPPKNEVIDSDGVIITQKTFHVSFVPQRGGTISVPPLSLTTFDPVAGVYKLASSRPFDITVEGGPPTAPSPTDRAPVSPAEVASPETVERYEPLGVWGRLAASVSVGAVFLFVGIVCSGLIIAGAGRAALRRRRRRDELWAAVGASSDPATLRAAVCSALAAEFGLDGRATFRDIVSEASAGRLDRDRLFALSTLGDGLDEAVYGDSPATDFEGLRRRATALRAVLPRSLRRGFTPR